VFTAAKNEPIAVRGRRSLRRHSSPCAGQLSDAAWRPTTIQAGRLETCPTGLWLLLVLFFAGIAGAADREKKAPAIWRYVAESAEPGFERPSLQKLACSDERPEDIVEKVAFRGTKRLYAQLRYGTPNSNRVTIVIDEREGGEFDLYVDRNRNRTIEPKDLVESQGALRTTVLAAEILKDDIAEHVPRRVVFRRSALDGGLSYATTGYMEGQIALGGRTIAVRRIDGDGNGFFADPRDRLWLDLDGDAKWDPFGEQFPLLPVMKVDNRRYAMRADAIGERLSLEEITGVGTIRLKLETLPAGSQVADLEVTLMGDDGSSYALRGAEEAVQVPVGKYALNTLSLSAQREQDSQPWYFVFSRSKEPRDEDWHSVERDADVAVDPIGNLRFALEFPDGEGEFAPGKKFSAAPRLYTQAGLLINSCSIGNADKHAGYGSGPGAEIQLISGAAAISADRSGFA